MKVEVRFASFTVCYSWFALSSFCLHCVDHNRFAELLMLFVRAGKPHLKNSELRRAEYSAGLTGLHNKERNEEGDQEVGVLTCHLNMSFSPTLHG